MSSLTAVTPFPSQSAGQLDGRVLGGGVPVAVNVGVMVAGEVRVFVGLMVGVGVSVTGTFSVGVGGAVGVSLGLGLAVVVGA